MNWQPSNEFNTGSYFLDGITLDLWSDIHFEEAASCILYVRNSAP